MKTATKVGIGCLIAVIVLFGSCMGLVIIGSFIDSRDTTPAFDKALERGVSDDTPKQTEEDIKHEREESIKNATAYYNKAIVLQSQNKLDEALDNIQQAIDTHPDDYPTAEAKKKEIEGQVAAQEKAIQIQKAEQEKANFMKNSKTISYKVLERDADSLADTKVYYRGKVFTIQATEDDSVCQLYVSNKGYDIWDDQVFLFYPGKLDVFKDDFVKIWGTVKGSHTYESEAGYNITVPSIDVKYYRKD